MKKLNILLLTVFAFITVTVRAQDQPPKLLIMGVPQYMFKNGIRIDLDIPAKNYRSWWVISPQYYILVSDIGNMDNKNYKQMHGYGLSVHRKGFLSGKNQNVGAYISGGFGFQHFNMLTNKERWAEVQEDGLNTMQLLSDDYHIYINKILTEAIIGYQKQIVSRLYIDIYAGIGLRYSFHDQPYGSDLKFNKNIIDYGYTGTAFIGGFRIGVGI